VIDVLKIRTEQEWIYDYVQNKKIPLPLVLGTKGTWTGNGKPMIILIAFTLIDVLALGDIYGVSHHPVRIMEYRELTYYAINIIEKKQVKEIIEEWSQLL
jgi:hypothetical protein